MGESVYRKMEINGEKLKAVCIGAGNVASVLAPALVPYINFIQVYSRTQASAEQLSVRLNCEFITDLSLLKPDCDFYLLSLNDSTTAKISQLIKLRNNAVWAHTSGSIPAEVLSGFTDNFGVFYPLQTFTKGREINLGSVPFFIEGSNQTTTDILTNLAKKLSHYVYEADATTREVLHIAGVMSCNFSTMLLNLTQKILASRNIPLSVVEPLTRETIGKCFETSPVLAQTGPASRGDRNVIAKHLDRLSGAEHEIYKLMSSIILKEFGHEQN